MTMIRMNSAAGAVRLAAAVGLLLAAAGLGGCDLEVTDSTKVLEEDLGDATGADLMRRQALRSFYDGEPSVAWLSGLLADEYSLIEPTNPRERYLHLDKRFPDPQYGISFVLAAARPSYQARHRVRYEATLAMNHLRAYAPESYRDAHMGQMLAVRGYSTLRLGEDWCPGFPLHELDGYTPVAGSAATTEQVFERALADLDSAVALAADSARILNFARVLRGRTLLNLGRYAEAAAAVDDVPTGYVYDNESGGNRFPYWSVTKGPSVADRDGGNGIDFVSGEDPRLTTIREVRYDGVELYRPGTFYPDDLVPTVLASAIEARLIEAEAALAAGGGAWLDILNDLRATQVSPGMEPLADPGSAEARVDMLFRERAFWLFGTGHRLADLRRLIRDYGRSSEAVFPTGPDYGTVTSLPFATPGYEYSEEPLSPDVTGCTGGL